MPVTNDYLAPVPPDDSPLLAYLNLQSAELAQSVLRGSRVHVRIRDAMASGYLLNMDSHDLLVGVTIDYGQYEEGEEPPELPMILVVPRRAIQIIRLEQDSTYLSEPDEIRSVLDPMRQDFFDHIASLAIPRQGKRTESERIPVQ